MDAESSKTNMQTNDNESTESDRLVTPDFFLEIAHRLHRGDELVEGKNEEGFVFIGRDAVFVGFNEGEGNYIIARMTKKSEMLGQHNPRQKIRENEFVEAELRQAELETSTECLDLEHVKEAFGAAERIDTGYINGYRVTHLRDVISEVFKWHDRGSES